MAGYGHSPRDGGYGHRRDSAGADAGLGHRPGPTRPLRLEDYRSSPRPVHLRPGRAHIPADPRQAEDFGQRPDGRPPAPVAVGSPESYRPTATESSYTWQEAIRTRTFWLINLGHAAVSIVVITMTVHLGLMLDDRGFSLQTVGWIVSTYLGVSAVFTLVGGYAGDRIPIRLAIFGFSAMQSVALLVLVLFESEPMAFLFAVLFGIGLGGRLPLTIAIRGVYFGRKSFASITGLSMIPMNVMLLAAPLFAAYMFDITGKYGVSFLTIAAVCFLGSCLFLLVGNPEPPPPPSRGTR